MQLRKSTEHGHVFGLKRALFSLCDVVELVICERVIEIGVGAIEWIGIHDVTSNGRAIQWIEIKDMSGKSKNFGPVFRLECHRRERKIWREEPVIDRGGPGIGCASGILLVVLL